MQLNNHNTSDEKMRVLRIAHSSLTPALRDRERALAARYPNLDLQVVTTERWREAEVDVEATEDDLFRVRTARTYISKHIQLFAYDPRPLIAALREHQPHLVDLNHEPYSVACAEVLTLCKRFAPQAQVVMQTAQNIFRRYPPPFNWLEQRALRRIAAAYVCSKTVAEVLRAKGFTKPAPIIPFGVNTQAFRPAPGAKQQSSAPPTIGFVGRMLPGKGLNILAAALSELAGEPWRLLVVGDGSYRKEFERRMNASGLLGRVHFTGAINYDLVPPYLHQMDLLVIPTETTGRIREQFGRVIVEAMASGVPVIGSTCGAIPEVIANAGLVVPEGDARFLAAAVRRLLADKALRHHLVRAGQTRVEKNYSWNQVAMQTYELYQRVLRERNSSVPSTDRELAPDKVQFPGDGLAA